MARRKNSYPNIIIILADDMGYGDVGCYGSRKIPTPNMDKIASEGIRFTDAHSSSAVCTPSRYSIMTGRYCWRSKLKRDVLTGYDSPIIEKERPTIASMLKKQGYQTAAIGKWHLGLEWPTKNSIPIPLSATKIPDIDFSRKIKRGPNDLGFDYFFGIAGSLDMPPYCFIENDHTVGIPNIPKKPLFQQQSEGLMVPGWRDDKVDITFTEKAKEFINQNMKTQDQNPFFLYLCTSAPHRPCDIRPDFVREKSDAGDRGDMVVLFDWVVGQINEELERNKLIENTFLIISSDNGARSVCFNGKDYGHDSNGLYRGQKGDIWEGGHRIPLIARYPSNIEPNLLSKEQICLVDLFATFSSMIGYEIPKSAAEDSINIYPILTGKTNEKNFRESMIHHSMFGMFAIRQEYWKFIKGLGSGGITSPRKIIPKKNDPKGQLYNLKQDPGEEINLWKHESKIVDKLQLTLRKIRRRNI
jgi:arylsulfatase A-like enzyme